MVAYLLTGRQVSFKEWKVVKDGVKEKCLNCLNTIANANFWTTASTTSWKCSNPVNGY